MSGTELVYGYESIFALLQRALQSPTGHGQGRPHQATLFLGARQSGKRTLAQAYAQLILCQDRAHAPCGACRACRLMSRGSHPDFRLIQPLGKDGTVDRLNGAIRSEQASELIHDAALRPIEGAYKVFLIQDFQQANDTFANKLLKTLEEPPDHVVLCLTATDRASVLPTIISRCRIIELRPLAPTTIAQALQTRWQATPEQADLLARLANGRLGWAVEQLTQPSEQQTRLQQLQLLWQLLAADRVERLAVAEQLASNRNNEQLFGLLETWLTWWRDLLLTQVGCGDQCANLDQLTVLQQQAQQVPLPAIQHYLKLLRQIEGYLHHTVNTRLALDVLFLQMPGLAPQPGVTS